MVTPIQFPTTENTAATAARNAALDAEAQSLADAFEKGETRDLYAAEYVKGNIMSMIEYGPLMFALATALKKGDAFNVMGAGKLLKITVE